MTILYGLGELKNYRAVFDIDNFLQHLPERLGMVLARRDSNAFRWYLGIDLDERVPLVTPFFTAQATACA